MQVLLSADQLSLTLNRLAHQLTENGEDPGDLVYIGLQPRGTHVAGRIVEEIKKIRNGSPLTYGWLDITFYRDDFRKELHLPKETNINFSIEGKKVILIDDVLYTGRTIRAALDALQDFGRPRKVELCVLINRRFNRELPIQPDYFGISIDTLPAQKVKVDWEQLQALLY
jgi:pyrimidine operon attenuation protein/uracil phosphoribosyltransferase